MHHLPFILLLQLLCSQKGAEYQFGPDGSFMEFERRQRNQKFVWQSSRRARASGVDRPCHLMQRC